MSKHDLRKKWREKRQGILPERRQEAAREIALLLAPRLQGPTLSFASFSDEIDLWPLNQILCQAHYLLLPGGDHDKLALFAVIDIAHDLYKSKKGYLIPKEDICKPVAPSEIAFVLVPALTFDSKGGRIGYGGGYYDRLLASLPKATHKIGVGFVEQLSLCELPHEPHDMPVDELVLV